MRVDTAEEIGRWLDQADALSEALLRELRLDRFGYSVHVVFSVVVERGQVLSEAREVVLDLDGVQELTLRGGLTQRMLENPEEIGWGLSEVALVRVTPAEGGVRFEALWEGDRKIEILTRRAALTAPVPQA